MLKIYNEEQPSFEKGNLNWVEGKEIQVSGKLFITKKSNRNNHPYLKVSLTEGQKTITSVIFRESEIYDFLEKHTDMHIDCVADIRCVKNGSYETIEYHRLQINVLSPEEEMEVKEQKQQNQKSISTRVSTAIKSIKNPVLRKLTFNIYRNNEIWKRLSELPATEFSAYNQKGGLFHMISDTVVLTNNLVNSLNQDFGDESVKFNLDLMKTGALLCNIGRAFYYEYDANGMLVKTESAIIDSEILLTRDIVIKELAEMKKELNEKGEPIYDVDSDIIKELLHMLASAKNQVEPASLINAKSKHASLLSHIVSVVFVKGLYTNLEKNGERVTRAYDKGKAYIIYEN